MARRDQIEASIREFTDGVVARMPRTVLSYGEVMEVLRDLRDASGCDTSFPLGCHGSPVSLLHLTALPTPANAQAPRLIHG